MISSRRLSISLFVLLFINSTSPDITGHWRRTDAPYMNYKPNELNFKAGDLILREDSTFIIVGDSVETTSDVPGWHAGGQPKGKWRMSSKDLLELWFYPEENKILLSYKIIKLSPTKLVLISSLEKKRKKKKYLCYKRI